MKGNEKKSWSERKIILGVLLYAALAILMAGIALGIPNSLTLQGKLTNQNGAAQASTKVNFTFKVYDSFTGGNTLYTKGNVNVSTDANGIYDIILDGLSSLNFSDQYYLGITVNEDNESAPRVNLTSSPYAFRANISEQLNRENRYEASVLNITGNLTIGNDDADVLIVATERLNISDGNIISGGNLTLAEKITFGLGAIIDNLANGFLRISSGLNVTGNVSIAQNTLFVDNTSGSVGIGTTTPNDILEVIGNVRVSGSLNASEINATKLRVNNTLFVNGSSVGIGTSAPTSLLTVAGNLSLINNSVIWDDANASNNTLMDIKVAGETYWKLYRESNTGDILVRSPRNGDANILRFMQSPPAGFGRPSNYSRAIFQTDILVYKTKGDETKGMDNIDAAYYFEGRFGGESTIYNPVGEGRIWIGSTSAAVDGMTGLRGVLGVDGGKHLELSTSDKGNRIGHPALVVRDGSTLGDNKAMGDKGIWLFEPLIFQTDKVNITQPLISTSNGTAIFINNTVFINNSVGVGTDSPQSYGSDFGLDVVGNIFVENQAVLGTGFGGIMFSDPDDRSEYASIYMDSTNNDLHIGTYESAWSDKLTVKRNGSVGIGTTAPLATLHVNGTGAQGGLLVTNDSGTKVFFVNSTSGRVGIRTTSPQGELNVVGQIYLEQQGTGNGLSGLLFSDPDDRGESHSIYMNSGDNSLRFASFSDSWGDRITITTAGSVGINTTTPAQTLTVQGTLNVTPAGQGSTPSIYVTSGGRVGIGTSAPINALTIIGDVSAFGSLNATYINATEIRQGINQVQTINAVFNIGNYSSEYAASGFKIANYSAEYAATGFDRENATDYIGGDNASLLRTINISKDLAKFFSNFNLGNVSNNTLVKGDNASLSLWNTSGANIFLREITWNVGIGAASPNARLVVIGNASFNRSTGGAAISIDTTNNAIFFEGENGSVYMPTYGSNDGLKLYYPFNANTSKQIDNSENANDGIARGGISCNITNGKYGFGCLLTSTTSDFINITSIPTSENSDYTISFFVKWNALDDSYIYADWFNTEDNDVVGIGLSNDRGGGTNTIKYVVRSGDAVVTMADTGIVPILNRWYHIAATMNQNVWASSAEMRIYVDGKLITKKAGMGGTNAGGGNHLAIGRYNGKFVDANVDELMIYSRALAPEEIAAHYLRERTANAITGDKFRLINSTSGRFFEINQSGFAVHTGGAERLKIDSSGNVGIGTTAPLQKLEVAGNILVNNTLNAFVNLSGPVLRKSGNDIVISD